MATSQRQPYSGPKRKLVVGIDVGTTFSGVSYCILDPGVVPVIQGVNRYPAQERVGGDAKIPSVIYYDSQGSVRAAGAEAVLESTVELARDQQWTKAEWFKLYLRPIHIRHKDLPPLPLNMTAQQVFGDFLRYLYDCTRTFITETHIGGGETWRSLSGHADFVLTHPNGWEGAQQAQMRHAAIHAGLVPDTPDGHDRIHFVTEGEASLLYCIGSDYGIEALKNGEGMIVVDAGGGTIDLSAYHLKAKPNDFEEIAPASCHFHGSIYVSRRARKFLQTKLNDSKYSSPDDIDHITECFDKTAKLAFKDPSQYSFVKFGSARDNDASVNIKFGQLKLQGSDVAKFFEPSVIAIQQAVEEQKSAALVPITSVLLVGGFSANTWLFSKLRDYLLSKGLQLYRPDGHLGKAVAYGAVSFLVDRFVSGRVARRTFGIKVHVGYDKTDPEHLRRSPTIIIWPDGSVLVPGGYDVILKKGTCVSQTTVFRRSYIEMSFQKSLLGIIMEGVLSYSGGDLNPRWVDVEPEMFTSVCTVSANVNEAVEALPPHRRSDGREYYRFSFDVELLFGLTEHSARICWKENGIEKRSPATMVYEDGRGWA